MCSRCIPAYGKLSVACSDITEKHRRLAEITEMIHTASLMHDDVVDESPTRRGRTASFLQCTPLLFEGAPHTLELIIPLATFSRAGTAGCMSAVSVQALSHKGGH